MVQNMIVMTKAALQDRKGVSALEYAVLAAGVIAAVTTALTGFGASLKTVFAGLITSITGATF